MRSHKTANISSVWSWDGKGQTQCTLLQSRELSVWRVNLPAASDLKQTLQTKAGKSCYRDVENWQLFKQGEQAAYKQGKCLGPTHVQTKINFNATLGGRFKNRLALFCISSACISLPFKTRTNYSAEFSNTLLKVHKSPPGLKAKLGCRWGWTYSVPKQFKKKKD